MVATEEFSPVTEKQEDAERAENAEGRRKRQQLVLPHHGNSIVAAHPMLA